MLPQTDDINTLPTSSSSIGGQEYAKYARQLIKLMTDLRALGAQAEVDLPRITVIGNQSAGKSSVVEAIGDITVPRDSGTCTRCPMECRLAYSKQAWKCQIYLRIEKDDATRETKETKFGPLITDKSKLEPMLRRAQLAILNPSLDPAKFVNYDLELIKPGHVPHGSERQLSFSSNVVCLDISGPNVPDLSFIDLPGIISNVAEGEDRSSIELIKNLVTQHIQGNALILLTITMRDDIENQSAAFLAKQADPTGSRTVGVLTKPDTLQEGEHDAWLEVLRGRRHPLRHGYFVTKQPAAAELGEKMSHEEARRREKAFFSSTAPWSALEGNVRQRIGVPNLAKDLSRLLSQLIEKTLPKLRAETKASMSQVQQALASLPPPPSENPSADLLRRVTTFAADVQCDVNGVEGHEALIRSCRPAYSRFKDDIAQTAPALEPAERSKDEGAEDSAEPKKMYLDDIRAHIQNSITRQLPFNTPFSAKVSLIEGFFDDWHTHCMRCFDTVFSIFAKSLMESADRHFGMFVHGGLAEYVKSVTDQQLDYFKQETTKRIEWFLELEGTPWTQNDHYFSACREKYIAEYRAQRKEGKGEASEDANVSNTLSELTKLGYSGLTEADLEKLRPADVYENELIVMAEVRAYFQVAYKRVIDLIPSIIDHDFLRGLAGNLQDALIQVLGLGDENAARRAAAFLSEDPGIVLQRQELSAKRQRLDGIIKTLFEFAVEK